MQPFPSIPPELIWATTQVTPTILALPGVVGIGLGMREENDQLYDELAVRVLVADASQVPPGIPDQVAGVRVCILERRDLKPAQAPPDEFHYDPVKGGIRISCPITGFGTLGCLVQDTGVFLGSTPGTLLGLTCQHVVMRDPSSSGVDILERCDGAPDPTLPGRRNLWQPKEPNLIVGTTPSMADSIGGIYITGGIPRLDYPQTFVPTIPRSFFVGASDSALVTLAGRGTSSAIVGPNDNDPTNLVGRITSAPVVTAGLQVAKRGFQTRVTTGIIKTVHMTLQWKPTIPDMYLLDCAEIEGDSSMFCDVGDSGALVVNRFFPSDALGLLWGRASDGVSDGKFGYITPITTVETRLGVKVAWAPP